jgi:beta-phosphoglucomutase-like phosphatase (HAD superfamily)
MNEEFVNTYIEMNNKKIEELTRSEVLLQTRLIIAEKMVGKLNEEKKKTVDDFENYKLVQNEVATNYTEKNKELYEENQKLIEINKKLIEEVESLKQAIVLASENQKNVKSIVK